jgi:glycosyltransferase involved in cell wall biosynthesis
MSKIPIFIIVHDRLEILKKSYESFEKCIKTPIEIVFHDVKSTYPPTLELLKQKKEEGYLVYRTERNDHWTVMNSVNDYLSKHPECEYFVITDPDIELDEVNGDILEFYIFLLNKFNVKSVGPMLRIDDIPNHYNKRSLVKTQHSSFWRKPRKEVEFGGNKYKYVNCMTDTTFQLRSKNFKAGGRAHSNAIRCFAPYSCRHLDWYVNSNDPPPCQEYYMKHTANFTHWSNPRWGKDRLNKTM